MNTVDLQRRLIALGFLPKDEDDGQFGAKTRAAVDAFQRAKGQLVDGQVGPKTLAALAIGPTSTFAPPAAILPRIEEARRNLGLRETKGQRTRPPSSACSSCSRRRCAMMRTPGAVALPDRALQPRCRNGDLDARR